MRNCLKKILAQWAQDVGLNVQDIRESFIKEETQLCKIELGLFRSAQIDSGSEKERKIKID